MSVPDQSNQGGSSMKRRQTVAVKPRKREAPLIHDGTVGKIILFSEASDRQQHVYDITSEKSKYIIGCGADCDIRTRDVSYISSRHFIIHVQIKADTTPMIKLEDCSTNGTYVNNNLILNCDVELKYGDHIDITGGSSVVDRLSFLFASPDCGQSFHTDNSSPTAKKVRTEISVSSSSSQEADSTNLAMSQPAHSSISSDVQDKLQCVICQEMLYKTATAIPCMHSFCGGCISSWHKRSTSCPLCNKKIESVSRNHTLDSLVDDVVKDQPSLARTETEKNELDSKDTIKYGTKFTSADESVSDESESDQSDTDDSDNDDNNGGGQHGGGIPLPAPPVIVRQCDIDSFRAITGASDVTARQILVGAIQRNLVPALDYAISYFFENNLGGP